ncbi:hypothetical protein ACFFX1_02515 [Dactylosporangium sucinum]|uniref:Uncharacterized protein n=1 Tax=Dactylosporangium sucinum TaxID=1424081 RepID=A0A917T2F7_9ACTN|nr:hypothetical protein [Dactylosporangium sucinum]GGM07560.1 hypothetical protein GCM10007977_005760 [Dactylosporangium sucinum]
MRKIVIMGATVVAGLAIGGTALAASGPDRRDDNPSPAVSVSTSDGPSPSGSPSPSDSPSPSGSPSTSATFDDHGGDRGGHGADDGPSHDVGDDHGGHGGHGGDDKGGDDHGGRGRH